MELEHAIEQFKEAKLAVVKAQSALDEAVELEIIRITNKLDPNAPNKRELLVQRLSDLQHLLDKLPGSYPGCRRIIEDMIRSEDFLNPKSHWPFA